LAELETIIADRRAASLRHELVDLAAIVRMQNIATRLRRALNLDVVLPPPAPASPTLMDILRSEHETAK
jgi:hypothetical protein